MNCSDARPLLDLLCDGALDTKDSALVLDHLKSCSECQRDWNDLEQLQARFREEKDKFQLPAGAMDRIADKLREEERTQQKRFFQRFVRVPILAVAASLALIGYPFLTGLQKINSSSDSMQTASADTLVEDLVAERNLEPMKDRKELVRKLGYDLNYLRLPEWQMDKSGLYKSATKLPIARFDFVRKGQTGSQLLSCYQARQGVIRAKAAEPENIEGKRVLVGSHGKFNFALWSQNGRDYLFVTALSKSQLEEIVRGA
jgi:hypothetical protein